MKRKNTLEYSGKVKEEYFQFSLIQQYLQHKPKIPSSYIISDQVSEDVDLKKFFKFIDRTISRIGQQFLFERINNIDYEKESIEKLESTIQYYENDTDSKKETINSLSKLGTVNDYYFPFLIFGDLPEKMKYFSLVRVLQIVSCLVAILSMFFHSLVVLLIPLFLLNLIIHYWHKTRVGNTLQIFYRLNKLTQCCNQVHSYSSEKSKEIKDSIKNVESLSSKISFLKTDHLKETEMGSIIWYFMELIKILTLSEVTFFHNILKQIKEKRTDIGSLYKFIGFIDMSLAISSLRSDLPYYSIPEITDSKKVLNVEGLFHPLVENCISNDLHLNNQSLLLTGSNMSGKSTFIKAISLNLIASQILNTSFSKSYKNPMFALSTSINISDNIEEGSSYYQEEVNSIGQKIDQSNSNEIQYLFIIDEVFKGTNTIERISAGKSILSYLNKKNHIVLVSTHDIELANMLEEEYDLQYFQEGIDDGVLSFDYKIKKGKLKNKNAINIMAAAGYPASIISEAQRLANSLEDEKMGIK